MKNFNLRAILSAICMVSVLAGFTKINAGPIRFDQVVQIVNARPGKASTGTFSRLRVADDYTFVLADDDDDKKKPAGSQPASPQDDRTVTESKSDITEDPNCDCEITHREKRCFPKWALLGLLAIPIVFIVRHDGDDDNKRVPTPTPTNMTPTPPGMTPTPTPPQMTPTPTPSEPVPEPITILLFGTGLASVGLAARRRFGKKGPSGDEKEEE
jgi:hypothetical protein